MSRDPDYSPESLVSGSRWCDDSHGWSSDQLEYVTARVRELATEHAEYCDAGNRAHMGNLFTGLALYEWHLSRGATRDEAYRLTAEPMWEYLERHSSPMKKLARIPGFFRLFGKLLPGMFERGSGHGWVHRFHPSTPTTIRFEEEACIYAQIFEVHGMRDVGCMFCHADEINYGSLPGITFTREHTLCSDGEPCDFLFEKRR